MEYYNPDKLYHREYVISRLKSAPREIRKHIKSLPEIESEDEKGNRTIRTKIPEVVHVYLNGPY